MQSAWTTEVTSPRWRFGRSTDWWVTLRHSRADWCESSMSPARTTCIQQSASCPSKFPDVLPACSRKDPPNQPQQQTGRRRPAAERPIRWADQ